jgi:hypothetical protein
MEQPQPTRRQSTSIIPVPVTNPAKEQSFTEIESGPQPVVHHRALTVAAQVPPQGIKRNVEKAKQKPTNSSALSFDSNGHGGGEQKQGVEEVIIIALTERVKSGGRARSKPTRFTPEENGDTGFKEMDNSSMLLCSSSKACIRRPTGNGEGGSAGAVIQQLSSRLLWRQAMIVRRDGKVAQTSNKQQTRRHRRENDKEKYLSRC